MTPSAALTPPDPAPSPAGVGAVYHRTRLVLHTLLATAVGVAVVAAMAPARLAPLLSPLPSLALLGPAGACAALVVTAAYFLYRVPRATDLQPSPSAMVWRTGLGFIVIALILSSVALAPSLDGHGGPSAAIRRQVLEQRALRHPDAAMRVRAARDIYLDSGTAVPYRDENGHRTVFVPGPGTRRARRVRSWLRSRPAVSPAGRQVILIGNLVMTTLLVILLPVVARAGRHHRNRAGRPAG
ncbi:MAG: hypothetical protein ACE5IK_00960 [Acidobacteriota bacterium]